MRSHGGMCIGELFWQSALQVHSVTDCDRMSAASSQLSKTLRRMLVRTQALVEAGVIEQPKWLDAVARSAPTLHPLPALRPCLHAWRKNGIPCQATDVRVAEQRSIVSMLLCGERYHAAHAVSAALQNICRA